MFKKRVLLIVLCMYIMNNLNAQFSGGSGTVDNPYIITTWKELEQISSYRDKHFKLNNDLDYDNPNHYGGYIKSSSWGSICSSTSNPFTGTFDGNNKTISNLYIQGGYANYYGLFGRIEGVDKNVFIKNLNLDNCDFTTSFFCYYGSIVGFNNGGVISNCTNKNSEISASGSGSGGISVGGIVGENHGIVENCTCLDNNVANSYSYSGSGMASYQGGIAGNNSGLITNCTIANNSINGSQIGGGIAGSNTNTGNIKNCSVFSSSLPSSGTIGGIVGSNSGNIDNCKNYISEISISSYAGIAGGIAGENSSDAVINSCVNYSNISVNGQSTSISGGISGRGGGKIVSCINYGTIEAYSSIANISYSSYAGGIAGTGGAIEKCYNFGNVFSSVRRSGSSTYGAAASAGGIGGSASANLCANSGNITARSSGDNVTSTSGGIVGNGSSVNTCYNTGFIQSDGTKGAIAGLNSGSISSFSNCYYLDLSCVNGIGNGISQGTTALTYTQMCHQNSYTNIDFTNIWEMQQGVPFPQLKGTVVEYVTKVSATPVQVSLNLTDSKSKTLTTSVEPINKNPNNSFLYYLSADKDVATVDDGTITAKNKGRTAVFVFSPHGGFNEEVDVLVDMIIKTPVTLNLSIPGKIYGGPFICNKCNIITSGRQD